MEPDPDLADAAVIVGEAALDRIEEGTPDQRPN